MMLILSLIGFAVFLFEFIKSVAKKEKIWPVMLIGALFCLLFVFTGINYPSADDTLSTDDSSDSHLATSQSASVSEKEPVEPEVKKEKASKAQNPDEMRTVFDGENTIIKTSGLQGLELPFYFENNSQSNLAFAIHSYAINGIMVDDDTYELYTNVAAGKKASNVLKIPEKWLESVGISDIDSIDILFWAYKETGSIGQKLFETNIIRFANDGATPQSVDGVEAYNNNGVSVKLISLDDESMTFSVANTSDQYFDFDLQNVSVNDWTYDTGIAVAGEVVFPQYTGIYTVEITPEFKTQSGIEKVQRVEFDLNVRPLESYFDAYDTKKIIFTS